MSTSSTRPALGPIEAVVYFLISALIVTITGLRSIPGVLHGDLINPDSYMRLDRLRDILERHAPLHVVLRDASGEGAVMSWSHFLDSLLLVLALPLRPFLDQFTALKVVAVASGPISVGLLGVAAAWAMAPLADRHWRWTAPGLVAMMAPIISYGVPGVLHHHILLALDAVMMAGLAGRAACGDRAAGVRLGAWAAAGIWLSPEAMPFALMAYGGAGLAWMLRPRDRAIGAAMALSGSVFLLLIACAFAVDPPFAGFGSVEIDRLSIVYLVLAIVVCAIGWLLRGLDRADLAARPRGIIATLAVIAGLALWFVNFPDVLRGPDGLLDSQTTQEFFGGIREMMPIGSVTEAAVYLADGLVAAVLLVWFALSRRSPLWAYAALCAGVVLVLGLLHVRFTTYAAAAAAMALPAALTEVTRLLAHRPPLVQAAARIGLVVLMVLGNRAEAVAALIGVKDPKASWLAVEVCPVGDLAPMLAPYAGQVVLTGVNDAPELLYRTGILTVGSLYHRNVAGFLRLRAAWRSGPSDTEPEAVRATRATLVLACTKAEGRSILVKDLPANTLLDRLTRGDVPPWLHQVAADPDSGQVLYRIVDPKPQQ